MESLSLSLYTLWLFPNLVITGLKEIYEIMKGRVMSFSERWTGPKALEMLIPVAERKLKFADQVGTQGLGANKAARYIGTPTLKDLREKVTEALVTENED